MRRGSIGAVMALGLAFAPGRALPPTSDFFFLSGHTVEIGQTESSPTEVRLFGFSGRQLEPSLQPSTLDEGCIELFRANVYEIACGVSLSEGASLIQAEVSNVLPSEVYDYDRDLGFTYREAGEIAVALTLTGDGAPQPAEPEGTGVGVCGLPPDIPTGGFALVDAPVQRAASIAGTLASDHLGSIEVAPLFGTITQTTFAYAGACL